MSDIRVRPDEGQPAEQDAFGQMFREVDPDGRPRRRRRLRGRRGVLIIFGTLFGLLGLLAGGAFLTFNHLKAGYDRNIQRFGDPFKAIPQASRPTTDAAASGAVNILLLGSDSRVSAGDPSQWTIGGQRTDAIMVLHIPANRKGAYIVSIPRDSWVTIPGHGPAKINAGFSFGGPTLMVETIESVTGVRIDHVAIVDFDGFKQITDALGGVKITVPKTVTSKVQGTIKAGTYTMDGATALTYVRQRYNLPGGDFDREKRQQNWMRAMMVKLMSKGTLTNPFTLNDVLSAVTKSLSTDDAFSIDQMQGLALSLRSVRSADVKFMTVPIQGTGWSPDHKQSIVVLDKQADAGLWSAVRKDSVSQWIATHDANLLGQTVR